MAGTMHELIREAITKGYSNADALKYAKKHHPYSEMTLSTVNYIRNQLRKKNPKILSDMAVRKRNR